MGLAQLLFGFAGSMGQGGLQGFEELMDHSGRKMGERMEKEGKLHYDMLDVHQRIDFKALITLDKTYVGALSHRMDKTEFELLQMMQMCTGCWRATINIMLDKWQNIIDKKEKDEKGTADGAGEPAGQQQAADQAMA